MKTLNLIGAGKVGQSLAKLWLQQGLLNINQVLTRSMASAQSAIDFIGAGQACENLALMQPADIIFLAVPDDVIIPVCQQLLSSKLLQNNPLIFHASGAVDAACLVDLSPHTAAVHPVLSFADKDFVVQNFSGTYCTLSGSETGKQQVAPLFEKLNAHLVTPEHLQPELYHAGLVFLSNYLLPLMDVGTDCLHAAGILKTDAKKMVMPLVQSVLKQAAKHEDWSQALTGPINRGDIATVLRHLQSLSTDMPEALSLYRELGQRTIGLAEKQGLPVEKNEQLTQLLEQTL